MKILGTFARGLFILGLPVLLLSGSIAGAVNSLALYHYDFNKYGISQVTGLAPAELDKAARGLISYFDSSEEYINVVVIKDGKPFPLFNEREIAHLKDVKDLIWFDYRLLGGTLVYVLGFAGLALWRKRGRQLASSVIWGSGITLGLMLALGIGALIDFEPLFIQFHLLSFANDFWQLDPSTDYLIMLVPQPFWNDVFLFVPGAAIIMAAVLGGVSGVYLKLSKPSKS